MWQFDGFFVSLNSNYVLLTLSVVADSDAEAFYINKVDSLALGQHWWFPWRMWKSLWRICLKSVFVICLSRTSQWCHNGLDSVSNHQPHDCLHSRLFRRRSKKASMTGEFPAQMASNADNVSIWWRHGRLTLNVTGKICGHSTTVEFNKMFTNRGTYRRTVALYWNNMETHRQRLHPWSTHLHNNFCYKGIQWAWLPPMLI